MKTKMLTRFLLAASLAGGAAYTASANDAGPPLAHMVFFTLKEHSPAARAALVASCQKYLSDHEGTISFSVGSRAEDVPEPVSDKDFDVALHLVFTGKAAKLKYLADPRHARFVEENKSSWSGARVFDSYLAKEVPSGAAPRSSR